MPQPKLALSEEITQREAAERALRDAQEFQSRLIACSQDCIKMLDLEGRLLWMNEGGMQALEICDLDPFVNSSWLEFWEGDDAKAVREAVETARKGGTGRFTGYFATTTTKQPRWWDVVVSPIRDSEGKPERLLAVSRNVTEHKRNEKALSEAHLQVARSEERWRSVFENSAIGVALTDLNGRFLATNHVFQAMLGYTEEELRALTFLDLTHGDYLQANWSLITELVEGKRRQFQIEKQYRRRDGSLIWVSNNVSLVPGSERIPQFLMALSEDITERKRAEAKLRRSEESLLEAQRLSHIGSWKLDAASGAVIVSPEIHRIFGVRPDEDTSRLEFWLSRNHPEDQKRIREFFERSTSQKTDYDADYRIVLPDGSIKHLHAAGHPVLNESGDLVEFVGTTMDVTEQVQTRAALENALQEIKQRNEALRAREQNLDLIINTIPALVWSARPDGSAEFFNQHYLDYVGLSAEQARDWGWTVAVHPDDLNDLIAVLRRMIASDKAAEFEGRLRRFDGEYRWFLFRTNPLRDASGKTFKWYGTKTDIDDRKRAEEKLRRSQ